jgi:transposase
MSTKKLKNKEKTKYSVRSMRVFSESFKKNRVSEIVKKVMSIGEISELYGVSRTSLYRWLYTYSPAHQKGTIQVVQMESEANKTKQLYARVMELEAALGRKQMELDYLEILIQQANEAFDCDLKKNFGPQQLNGLETTKNNSTTN